MKHREAKDKAKHQQHSVDIKASEEFPVFDFSIPLDAMSEQAEGDDGLSGDEQRAKRRSEIEASVIKLQDFLKEHVNNLWRELDQVASSTELLKQEQDAVKKQQLRGRQWLLVAVVLLLIGTGIWGWMVSAQEQRLTLGRQDSGLGQDQKNESWLASVKLLQQQVQALQSEQQQLKTDNSRLQNRIKAFQQSPEQTGIVPLEMLPAMPATTKTKLNVAGKQKWLVSLGAFQQQADAKQQALVLMAKQVPAIVAPISDQGEIKYQVIVDGFENKREALVYAHSAKQAHNLASTWVVLVQ